MTTQETLEAVRLVAREAATAGELPAFLGAVQQVCAEALLAAATPGPSPEAPGQPGRILTVQEAAQRLGRSRWWVYRHKATLPVTRFQTGGFGIDERALERWIERRTK
jgi:hypothetical protein